MLRKIAHMIENHKQNKAIFEYRKAVDVSEIRLFGNGSTRAICPRCRSNIDIEYINFCKECGQCLGWSIYERHMDI